jgi:ABC-type amino acid transport substrate-binding protein
MRKICRMIAVLLVLSFANISLSAHADIERIRLTAEERAYLSSHSPIKLCIDPNWMPYEAWDIDKGHVGIAADYIAVFAAMLNTEFEVQVTKTWQHSLDATRNGSCDVLSFLNQTPRRSQWLLFTAPYVDAAAALATHKDVHGIRNLKSLRGKTVAVVEGYVYEEYLRNHYPKVIVTRVSSTDEALYKTAKGEIVATIESLFVLRYKIAKLGLTNLTVSGRTKYVNHYRFGVRKDQPMLREILDKAIIRIEPKVENKILRKWSL